MPNVQDVFSWMPAAPLNIQEQTDAMMQNGQNAMSGWFNSSSEEANTAQEKVLSMSNEVVNQATKSAEWANRSVQEVMDGARENAEAATECSQIAQTIGQSIGEEFISAANRSVAKNVELSQKAFKCRTLKRFARFAIRMPTCKYGSYVCGIIEDVRNFVQLRRICLRADERPHRCSK